MRNMWAALPVLLILASTVTCTREVEVEKVVVVSATPARVMATPTPAPRYQMQEVIGVVKASKPKVVRPDLGILTLGDQEDYFCAREVQRLLLPYTYVFAQWRAIYTGAGRWFVHVECHGIPASGNVSEPIYHTLPGGEKFRLAGGSWSFLEDGNQIIEW